MRSKMVFDRGEGFFVSSGTPALADIFIADCAPIMYAGGGFDAVAKLHFDNF